ncbi:MAG: pyridoxamine 5'-phosphate oxidase [Planctomycetota bacterium]
MRRSYQAGQLIESDTPADDPFALFRQWFSQATETARQHRWAQSGFEPNAVTLATADANGQPAARVVLLKGVDHGLVFYSNYQSAKGQHLAENPVACLNFYWPWLERQCRLSGPVERIPRETSEAYFRSRPHGSQLGAIASDQSRPVADRDALDRKLDELESAHPKDDATKPIPFPDDWGGYRLTPLEVEFWQGRDNRMHDRLVYRRPTIDTPTFTRVRLQP